MARQDTQVWTLEIGVPGLLISHDFEHIILCLIYKMETVDWQLGVRTGLAVVQIGSQHLCQSAHNSV